MPMIRFVGRTFSGVWSPSLWFPTLRSYDSWLLWRVITQRSDNMHWTSRTTPILVISHKPQHLSTTAKLTINIHKSEYNINRQSFPDIAFWSHYALVVYEIVVVYFSNAKNFWLTLTLTLTLMQQPFYIRILRFVIYFYLFFIYFLPYNSPMYWYC